MRLYARLRTITFLLAFGVVLLGAFVRLSDAGLGCPDWPGCYGHLTPLHAQEKIAAAESLQPGGPVTPAKAWKEMLHRYLAGLLGLLILALAVLAWRKRRQTRHGPGLAIGLLGLVVFQAMLGMWTVTELLKPIVVTAHLLGGMATLAGLYWLWLRERGGAPVFFRSDTNSSALRASLAVGLVLVVAQITLGGWVSTNYAALACTDFPRCHGAWLPDMAFEPAFTLHRELGMDGAGALLSSEALTAIHWVHRMGAVLVALYLIWLARRVWQQAGGRPLALALLAILGVQLSLGIANVLLSLPLGIAVLHNGGAALLLLMLVRLNVFAAERRD
jgi:cytochrome c oxidase assembly protein subunit 15